MEKLVLLMRISSLSWLLLAMKKVEWQWKQEKIVRYSNVQKVGKTNLDLISQILQAKYFVITETLLPKLLKDLGKQDSGLSTKVELRSSGLHLNPLVGITCKTWIDWRKKVLIVLTVQIVEESVLWTLRNVILVARGRWTWTNAKKVN